MTNTNKTPGAVSGFVIFMLTVVFLGLLVAGFCVISESRTIYRESVDMTNKMLTGKSAQMIPPGYTLVREGYSQALSFFMLAAGILIMIVLLPRIQNFSISPVSGISFTLSELRQNVAGLIQQTNQLQQQSVGDGLAPAKGMREIRDDTDEAMLTETMVLPKTGDFGGKKELNNYRISAKKIRDKARMQGFLVTVQSTNPGRLLKGAVVFHLPANFENQHPVIIAVDGKAELSVRALQPFIIGASVEDGKTILEFDLREAGEG